MKSRIFVLMCVVPLVLLAVTLSARPAYCAAKTTVATAVATISSPSTAEFISLAFTNLSMTSRLLNGTRQADLFLEDDYESVTVPAASAPDAVDEYAEPVSVFPPPDTEKHTFQSQATGRYSPYLVYLPPDYNDHLERRYPVLYMLHGVGGNDPTGQFWEWEDDLRLLTDADRMIRADEIEPMIIVLPQGEDGYWVDQADGGPQWGTFVARELAPLIDAEFRTIPTRESRAIGGLSMGAHGALQIGMNFPDVFGVVGAHSPTIRGQDTAPAYFGDTEHFQAHDPTSLVIAHPEIARTLKIWLDVGQQDEIWGPVVKQFRDLLDEENIPYTWYSGPGEHHGDYWRSSSPTYLRFYSSALDYGSQENLTPLAQ